ncbi:MAG: hypothetical protein A2133_09450 [Actinobacteria bacterium RBG_16_64_13]|nr:MAG: hypothetical protein A2133_09450 [Actinobacteria bacterium RBG_16_64_13]
MKRKRPAERQVDRKVPRISIGLPVHNGGRLLEQAIRCHLEQDYEDLELIISDNASTDDTQDICEEYARRDPRVRYYRNPENLGMVANFNRVFMLARGEYFKWAAHDDSCAPNHVSRCVELLDDTPTAVLCQSQATLVDEEGRVLQALMDRHDLCSPDPVRRFHHVLWKLKKVYILFGLIRRQQMAATPLLTQNVGSDRVLLASLSLMGELRQVPEPLFVLRDTWSARDAWDSATWAPENMGRPTLLYWRMANDHAAVVRRSDLSTAQKGLLLADITARYGVWDLPKLAYDLYLGAGEIVYRRPYKTRAASGGSWLRRW